MAWKITMGGAALLLCLAVVPAATAGETFRVLLDEPANVPSEGISGGGTLTTLELNDEDSDEATEYIYWGRGWGYGWRGGYGYRGFYRPYVFRPWLNGYAYRPFFRPFAYARWYGYSPSYYYYNPCPTPYYYYYSYAPSTVDEMNVTATVAAAPQNQIRSGTYRYDGGPTNPVPYPRQTPDVQPGPPPAPRDSIEVSTMPARKHTYPAYGETPVRTSFAEDRVISRR